jgi:hypothetical protein
LVDEDYLDRPLDWSVGAAVWRLGSLELPNGSA